MCGVFGAVMPGAPNVPSGDAIELPPADPERLVILQYTSGSTSEPKGVMIPDRVLTANIDASITAAAGGAAVCISPRPEAKCALDRPARGRSFASPTPPTPARGDGSGDHPPTTPSGARVTSPT